MRDNEVLREKLKTSEFRDITSEKVLIAGILKYRELARKCLKEVDSNIFSSDRCKTIYEAVIRFFDVENVIMNTEAFTTYLDSKPQVERNSLLKLWNIIYKKKNKVKKPSALAVISKLKNLYKGRLVEIGMHKAIPHLKKAITEGHSNIDNAIKEYLSVTELLQDRDTVSTITDPLSLYQDFKTKHIQIQKDPSLLRTVPTGLKPLDDIIVGLRPSEFGLITAGTGIGKTIMLGDFAFSCFLMTGDVLYVTIEMPENQVRERFYCRLSGIDYTNFRRYKLSDEHWKILDRKIGNLQKDHEYKYHILDMPASCSVRSLKNEIEEHIRKNGEPRLIIIDYMNILHGGFDWSKQIEISVEIKQQIARYFKIATWSANQLMGSKHDKEVVRIGDMAFAKNITDNVDIGIGIGMTDASEEDEIFKISFTKTRDFKGKSFNIEGDRGRMTFCKSVKDRVKEDKFKKKEKVGGKVKI